MYYIEPADMYFICPEASSPGSTGYDAVQNRFSGQVGVNFETLEAMGHIWAGLPLSLSVHLNTLTFNLFNHLVNW